MAIVAQAHVDEEIAKQICSLCDLRTQRNSFSLISHLPTETLAAIFVCSARDYYSTRYGYPTETAPSWVNISYVCRHWHNVALNCATLWTYLFITSPCWTEELLARSKQASLKLHAEVVPRDADRGGFFVGQVMNHVERVQELHLDLPHAGIEDLFVLKLSSCAPRLQSLKISVWNDSHSNKRLLVPFNGDTPILHTLELSRCSVPWYSFNLSALTTLSLRSVPSQCRQNMVEFLATLSCVQDLRHLYLENALASTAGFLSSTEFHSFQKINLPCLSRLLIAAPLSTVTTFVACVNIPSKAKIRLDCGTEDGLSLHDYASLFSVLAQRFSMSTSQALSSPTFRSLVIECLVFRFTLSSLERDCDSFNLISHQDWGCNASLRVKFCLDSSMTSSSVDYILGDISSFVPLADVQSVHVISPPLSPDFWRNMSGHLQDLWYIKLSFGHMPDLTLMLSSMDTTAHEDADGQSERTNQGADWILAPVLEELELYDVTFVTQWSQKNADTLCAEVESLCGALAARKGSSGKLTITRCIECIRRGMLVQEKCFDMVGLWKNGFHVVKKCEDEDT